MHKCSTLQPVADLITKAVEKIVNIISECITEIIEIPNLRHELIEAVLFVFCVNDLLTVCNKMVLHWGVCRQQVDFL